MEELEVFGRSRLTCQRALRGVAVRVTTGSRLHFGLYSFGKVDGLNFGGLGAMIEAPSLVVVAEPASCEPFEAIGPCSDRVIEFASRWATFYSVEPSGVRFTIESAPPQHHGFGAGTQLALATAVALYSIQGQMIPEPAMVARSVQRGARSAIGVHGFFHGGILAERGKSLGDDLSPLDCRLDLPNHWRFLIVTPQGESAIHGKSEASMFANIRPSLSESTAEMIRLTRDRIFPSIVEANFDEFAEAIGEYGKIAGSCFADMQGGVYRVGRATQIVRCLEALGARGVGQSSWGPTIFCVCKDDQQASAYSKAIESNETLGLLKTHIVAPKNSGATIEAVTCPSP